ncbi:MAG: hypothetical protein ACP5U2_14305 [Bryobacteraceae bacterium]
MATAAWLAMVATMALQPSPSRWLASAAPGAPLVVVLPGSQDAVRETFERWRAVTATLGWGVLVPGIAAAPADAAVLALEALLDAFVQQVKPDRQRVYLAGEGAGGSAVFYVVSRRPDLWAAAAALGGNPRPAIETNRLFAANTSLVTVLWVPRPGDALAGPMRARLREAGYNLLEPPRTEMSVAELLQWLGRHRQEEFPYKIDCETGHPAFARCYWAEISRLDFSQRNDALAVSRVPPGSGAYVALGGFGFDPSAPGPGVLVGWLPENYKGPLRMGDRIVAVGGHEIADGRAYVEFMERQADERATAVTLLRDGRLMRVETRIVLPRREEVLTARVRAEYLPETRELLVVSRGVAALRLRLPVSWIPARINWNGTEAGTVERAGCWELEQGSPPRPCPQ